MSFNEIISSNNLSSKPRGKRKRTEKMKMSRRGHKGIVVEGRVNQLMFLGIVSVRISPETA